MNARWSSSLSWDTRVVHIERQHRWWWNAWHASAATELYGFADSREETTREMFGAIEEANRAPVARQIPIRSDQSASDR